MEWIDQLDTAALRQVDLILAADVIYDDDITDAFFHKLRMILWGKRLDDDDEEEEEKPKPPAKGKAPTKAQATKKKESSEESSR